MFLTDAAVLLAVANAIHQDVTTLPAFYASILDGATANTGAHNAAYQEIVGALIGRGFNQAQINGWDLGSDYELALTLLRVFTNAGVSAAINPEALNEWRTMRKQLTGERGVAPVQLFVGGVWQQPAAAPNSLPGQVMTGRVAPSHRAEEAFEQFLGRGDGEWGG